MVYFETERLVLRNLIIEDVEDFFEFMSLPETALHEDFEPYTYQQSEQAIKRHLEDDCYWAVVLKGEQKMIGLLNYSEEDFDTYEIGYDFNPYFGKKGYATEACKELLNYLFEIVGARRIIAGCNEENKSSWQLLERLGFRREGFFLEDVTFKQDSTGRPIYVNSYYYGLLQSEWKKKTD